jgi:hypothetical protein
MPTSVLNTGKKKDSAAARARLEESLAALDSWLALQPKE